MSVLALEHLFARLPTICVVWRTRPGSSESGVMVENPADPGPVDRGAATAVRLARRRARVDLVLVATVAVAAVLRFWRLGAQALWYDELSTARIVEVRMLDLLHEIHWREGT